MANAGRTYNPVLRLARRPLVAKRHHGLDSTNVYLGHYPKSGGTWLKLMTVELVLNEKVGFGAAEEAMPFVGRHQNAPQILVGGGRLIKTHESYRDVYRRAIFLIRDVRDVLVSYFHYWQI